MLPPIVQNIVQGNYDDESCPSILWCGSRSYPGVVEEVDELCRSHPASEVHREGHATYWTKPYGEVFIWNLLQAATNDQTGNWRTGKPFPHREAFPILASIYDDFPTAVNFRINQLHPHSGLSPHRETMVVRLDGKVVAKARFHIPIFTHPSASVWVDNMGYHLKPGQLYFFHNGRWHSATNRSDSSYRTHLVFDCLVDEHIAEILRNGLPINADDQEWFNTEDNPRENHRVDEAIAIEQCELWAA